MKRAGLSAVLLLAMFAISAAFANAAFAEGTYKEGCTKVAGTRSTICLEASGKLKELESGTVEQTIKTDTNNVLSVEKGPTITCKEIEGTSTATAASDKISLVDSTFKYKGCKVTNTKETEELCTVTEPITAEGSAANPPVGSLTLKGTKTNETFTEITIKGTNCTFKGEKQKVKGSQTCEWKEPEVAAVEKLLNCTKGGSK